MKHDIITQVQSEIASLKRITPDAQDRKSPATLKQACASEKRPSKKQNACCY